MILSYTNGIRTEAVPRGLLVHQYDQSYIARGWGQVERVDHLIKVSLNSGMRWIIREGHPQVHARGPDGSGRVYLAFSPTRENHWSYAIDTFNIKTGDIVHCVFNGKYKSQFDLAGIDYSFEKRNLTAGHLVVRKEAVFDAIAKLKAMDHQVLYLGRDAQPILGFRNEYDIQRSMIQNWAKTPIGKQCALLGDEVPVDKGVNPRRMDLLAHDAVADHYFVLELKRASAKPEAVAQLNGYLTALGRDPIYRCRRCGQTNANSSPISAINLHSGGELAPFGLPGGSVLFAGLAAVSLTFSAEVIVGQRLGWGELLKCLDTTKWRLAHLGILLAEPIPAQLV